MCPGCVFVEIGGVLLRALRIRPCPRGIANGTQR